MNLDLGINQWMNAKGLDKHGRKIGLWLGKYRPGWKMAQLDFFWVEIVLKYGWSFVGGFWLGGLSKSRFRLDDLGGFRLGGFRLGGFWIGGFWIRECCLG